MSDTETANYDPEAALLYCLVKKPALIHSVHIDGKWFSDPKLNRLARYLIQKDGSLTGYIQIRGDFDSMHAGVMSRDDWDRLLTAETTTTGASYWAATLYKGYERHQARLAADAYAKQPTDDNLNAVIERAAAVAKADEDTHETTLKDLGLDMQRRMRGEVTEQSIKTWTGLDNVLGGLNAGELITIGARPAVGKSAFAVNLIMSALEQQPSLKVDLFSLEMSNGENYRRIMSYLTRIPGQRLKNPAATLDGNQASAVLAAQDKLQRYDLQLYELQTNLEHIVQIIRTRAAEAQDGYLAVVDYLQLIDVRSRADRRLQIEQITRTFKQLTNELGIPIVLLSQLSRAVTQRQDQAPVLSDLRESGSIEQDSNAVLFLYNEDNDQGSVRPVTLKVAKNRSGGIGDVHFRFYPAQMRFEVKYV